MIERNKRGGGQTRKEGRKKKLFDNCGLRCRSNPAGAATATTTTTSSRLTSELLKPPHARGVPRVESRARALAFCAGVRAPQHVLGPRDVEETVGPDADFDLQPAARVKVVFWSRTSRSCSAWT